MKDYWKKFSTDRLKSQLILVGTVNRFENLYQSGADAVFDELTWKQMFFLTCVSMFFEPPSIRDMADMIGCTHQNANKMYAKLLREGYIRSELDEEDKRKQRLYLTDKGKAFLSHVREDGNDTVDEIFKVLTPEEIETVIGALTKLIVKLEEMAEA